MLGFELEGITILQVLRRLGYWELAECVETHFKGRNQQLALVTMDSVAKMKATAFENIGIFQQLHIRAMVLFKDWCMKKTPEEKISELSLMNYYDGPYDPRGIHACIGDAEDKLCEMFSKAYPSISARIKGSVGKVIVNTPYPYTKTQVGAYLKHYQEWPRYLGNVL